MNSISIDSITATAYPRFDYIVTDGTRNSYNGGVVLEVEQS